MAKSAFTDGLLLTVKPPLCTSRSVGLMDDINKDVTGAKLLPTTVSTCAMD